MITKPPDVIGPYKFRNRLKETPRGCQKTVQRERSCYSEDFVRFRRPFLMIVRKSSISWRDLHIFSGPIPWERCWFILLINKYMGWVYLLLQGIVKTFTRIVPLKSHLSLIWISLITILIETPARSRNHFPSQRCTHSLDMHHDSKDIYHLHDRSSHVNWSPASRRYDARHAGQLCHHAMPTPAVEACTRMCPIPLRVGPLADLPPPSIERAPRPRAQLWPARCCRPPRGCSTWPQ